MALLERGREMYEGGVTAGGMWDVSVQQCEGRGARAGTITATVLSRRWASLCFISG